MKQSKFQVLNGLSVINKIYSDKILQYAAHIPLQKRLEIADASASKRSNFCGSKISVDICVENGKIVDFGQAIDACALGSAAAAIVAEYIIGAGIDEVLQAQIEMSNMLKHGGFAPNGRFAELSALQMVSNFPNRHASTMLILDALTAAIEDLK